jgi:hypothetical protein
MNALVQWQAVTTNSDGTPITDLAGYYVYHGFVTTLYDPGIFVAAPTIQYLFTGLEVGLTHYFNVKAADTSGNLSAFGGEVTKSEPYPVYPMAFLMGTPSARQDRLWKSECMDRSSGFMADVLGLNLPPIEPPPPEQFPIYEAIGGFMIV